MHLITLRMVRAGNCKGRSHYTHGERQITGSLQAAGHTLSGRLFAARHRSSHMNMHACKAIKVHGTPNSSTEHIQFSNACTFSSGPMLSVDVANCLPMPHTARGRSGGWTLPSAERPSLAALCSCYGALLQALPMLHAERAPALQPPQDASRAAATSPPANMPHSDLPTLHDIASAACNEQLGRSCALLHTTPALLHA